MKRLFAFLYVGLVMSMVGAGSAVAQTASALYEFGGGGSGDGDEPTVLIQAQDGNFYGITAYGGNASGCTDDNGVPTGCGTIFKISPGGSESVLYKFSGGTDGGIPNSLIQGPDGNIYGTTLIGGQPPSSPNQCNISSPSNPGQTAGPCCPPDSNGDAVGCGTIFVFAPTQAASVTPTTLYSFTGTADGGSPGTLIVGTNSSGARLIFGTTLSCSNCFYPSSSGLFLSDRRNHLQLRASGEHALQAKYSGDVLNSTCRVPQTRHERQFGISKFPDSDRPEYTLRDHPDGWRDEYGPECRLSNGVWLRRCLRA